MLSKFNDKKSVLSCWVLFFFIITLAAGAFISELFQAPSEISHKLGHYSFVFDNEDLKNINKITLKNRLGEFHVEKSDTGFQNDWKLINPRKLPANYQTIEKILNSLDQVKIRRVYLLDHINLSNFYLKPSQMKITLFHSDNRKHVLHLGLKNSIDNSTYMMLSDRDTIYHTDALKNSLETLDLSDFIDSKIISTSLDKISSLKIFRGKIKHRQVSLGLFLKDNEWYGRNNKKLNKEKVEKYIQKLLSINIQTILDKINEKTSKKIEKHLSNAMFSVEITNKENHTFSYSVSTIVYLLPGIKMEKRQNFIVSASNRMHPYLVNKEYLYLFAKTLKNLKK